MPLFMDIQTFGKGISVSEMAKTGVVAQFGASCLRYWVCEPAGMVFRLIEADTAELARVAHRATTEPVNREVYPVTEHTWYWARGEEGT